MENNETPFEIETLQDWQLSSTELEQPGGGGASNSNSCCNNSADEP